MPLKLDKLLTDPDRAAFNELVARPATTGDLAHAWLRGRGYVVSINSVYAYIRRVTPGRQRKQYALKLDRILKPEDRAELEAMIADPGRTVDDIHRFLLGRGYQISRIGVYRHRKRWQGTVDKVRDCARFAASLARVAAVTPPEQHGRGSLLGLDQVVMQKVFEIHDKANLGPRDLAEWAGGLEAIVNLRDLVQKQQRRDERAQGRSPGARPAPGGIVNGVEIANTVRRILGVPLPGERTPGLAPTAARPALPPASTGAITPIPPLPPGEGRGEGM